MLAKSVAGWYFHRFEASNRKGIWNFAIRCQEGIGDKCRRIGVASDFKGLPDDWRLGSRARQLNVNTAYICGPLPAGLFDPVLPGNRRRLSRSASSFGHAIGPVGPVGPVDSVLAQISRRAVLFARWSQKSHWSGHQKRGHPRATE